MLFAILKIGFSICVFLWTRFMEECAIPDKFRSSRLQMFFKIGVLKNFTNFTEKHLCWSSYLIKIDSKTGVFFSQKSIFFNTEKHCAKNVQSETENKFCKTKCVKLNYYKCAHFLLFLFLSILWIYHFHCFPILFLLLYLSFHLDSVWAPPWFPALFASPPRFQTKILSYFSLKVDTPFCYYCLTLAIKPLLTLSEMSSVISPNKNYLKVPKTYNLWSISNNYEWMKYYVRFIWKRSITWPKLSIFL